MAYGCQFISFLGIRLWPRPYLFVDFISRMTARVYFERVSHLFFKMEIIVKCFYSKIKKIMYSAKKKKKNILSILEYFYWQH